MNNRVAIAVVSFLAGFVFGTILEEKRHSSERDKGEYIHTRG